MPLIGLSDVIGAIDDIESGLNDKLRDVYLKGFKDITERTPEDTRAAQSNYFISVGAPSNKTTDDTSGNPHLEDMPAWVLGKKIYYTNNLPYMVTLEYGGYKGVGPKTQRGPAGIFSTQGVGGFVRRELLVMRAAIRRIK